MYDGILDRNLTTICSVQATIADSVVRVWVVPSIAVVIFLLSVWCGMKMYVAKEGVPVWSSSFEWEYCHCQFQTHYTICYDFISIRFIANVLLHTLRSTLHQALSGVWSYKWPLYRISGLSLVPTWMHHCIVKQWKRVGNDHDRTMW